MFPDDIELSRQNHRELEEDLEIWRNALERRGLKVSRSKAEYLIVGGTDIVRTGLRVSEAWGYLVVRGLFCPRQS